MCFLLLFIFRVLNLQIRSIEILSAKYYHTGVFTLLFVIVYNNSVFGSTEVLPVTINEMEKSHENVGKTVEKQSHAA